VLGVLSCTEDVRYMSCALWRGVMVVAVVVILFVGMLSSSFDLNSFRFISSNSAVRLRLRSYMGARYTEHRDGVWSAPYLAEYSVP